MGSGRVRRLRVAGHQLISRRCACGATTCGTAPEGVTAPAQYGPRVTAIIRYLHIGQFLYGKRTARALAGLSGTPVSEGTVATMTSRAADGLKDFPDVVRHRIADAEVAGFDETGLRVARTLHWVRRARTEKHTLITCHAKRGRKGIGDPGVPVRFRGVAVHDARAPCDTCLGAETPTVLRARSPIATGADTVDADALTRQIQLCHSAAQIGITETATRSDAVMRKHNALTSMC